MAERVQILLSAIDKTKKAFQSVDNRMTKLKKSSATLNAALGPLGGAAAAAGIIAIGRNSLKSADQIGKMSIRLGASAEALSQYRLVASKADIEFKTLTMGWQRMTRRVSEAAHGFGEAKAALKELKQSAADLNKLTPSQQFEQLADALMAVPGPADRVRLAMKLFDSEGVSLLQTMEDGSAGIRKIREEMDRMGGTVTKEMTEKAAAATSSISSLSASMSGLGTAISVWAAPGLTSLADNLTEAFSGDKLSEMMQQLAKDDPTFHAHLRNMSEAVGGLTKEWVISAVAAHKAGIEFSMLERKLFQGTGLGTPDVAAQAKFQAPDTKIRTAAEETEEDYLATAIAAGELIEAEAEYLRLLRQRTDLLSPDKLKDYTAVQYEALDAEIAWGQEMSENVDIYQRVQNEMAGMRQEAGTFANLLEVNGVMAANMFGDAIVDAAMRGGDALEALGNIARSVLSSIVSGLISFGITSILSPAAAAGGLLPGGSGFIGPVQSAAPAGGGGTTINSLTVNANSTLNTDPMSLRRLALQLQDEITRVGDLRGGG